MEAKPTRREALVTIAAAGAAAPAALSAAEPYQPVALSADDFRRVTALVDMIIPPTDTPGAAEAGVAQYVDEEAQDHPEIKAKLLAGLRRIAADGFDSMIGDRRVELLQAYSEADDERREIFTLLKNLTVDGYYSSEIGLVQELGYKGNTFLAEFPGCEHEEHQA